MGLLSWWSRVGSDPYYASYEKALQRIKDDIDKARARGAARQQLCARVQARFWAGFAALYAIALAYAAWVVRQPQGAYTPSEHAARVAPVLLLPLAAYLLHRALGWGAGALARRSAQRVRGLEGKQRKMVTELKDSTHYEKTLQLLKKYDPDFVPPAPPPMPPAPGAPRGKRGALPAAAAAGTLLPALGQLWSRAAETLIADDPVMVRLMREAQSEAEHLRARLAAAEARAAALGAENAELRNQLGLPEPPEIPSAAAAAEPAAVAPAGEAAAGLGEHAAATQAAAAAAAADGLVREERTEPAALPASKPPGEPARAGKETAAEGTGEGEGESPRSEGEWVDVGGPVGGGGTGGAKARRLAVRKTEKA